MQEMQPLADAALSRSESDWLVGINATRALTAFNSQGGGFQKTTSGRVQTPTLAILAEREEKIRRFVPRRRISRCSAISASPPAAIAAAGSIRRSRKAPRKTRAPSGSGRRKRPRRSRRQMPGQAGHDRGGKEALHASAAAAVRSHDAPARGERPPRLPREDDAANRAGALREAQGAHLSANRFALSAGGPSRHGEAGHGFVRRSARWRATRRTRCARAG